VLGIQQADRGREEVVKGGAPPPPPPPQKKSLNRAGYEALK